MARMSRGGIFLAAGWMLGLCLLAVPARAMVVTVDLGWGWNANSDTDLGQYALQEGSIVQVIMFNSATAGQPGTEASDNFPAVSYGYNYGAGVSAEPYPGTEPDHVSTDNNIYNPNLTPAGHVIAYTTEIGSAINPNANGYDWYNIYAQFTILGTYDSLYIRVFGATEFPTMEVVASYWGISTVQSNGGVIGTWYVMYDDVTATNHVSYFEVIPEPGSMALFVLGGAALWTGRRRRSKRT